MYLTIGETKLLVGQYGEGDKTKLELNFEYAFDTHGSYRRFAKVIFEPNQQQIVIKLKSDFKLTKDCLKLSRLLIGLEKLLTIENLSLLLEILEPNSKIDPKTFVERQKGISGYFL